MDFFDILDALSTVKRRWYKNVAGFISLVLLALLLFVKPVGETALSWFVDRWADHITAPLENILSHDGPSVSGVGTD